ncbi:hypothetical protein HS048_35455 [Planomonospora sp. ID91781]|uniref:hypothetical protein n=1 Tax=Planomonospora sp. ID91781 TaxID=2738135 RepID=UPI0018C3835C|nr:hypothetical protein [Planomonospora sp. ID91781]MBG0825970.1 hypothetical protein [Planomonospora sp. ID91781]
MPGKNKSTSVARFIVAAIVFCAIFYWSLFLAAWTGWGGYAKGWPLLKANIDSLIYIALTGIAAIAAYRFIIGCRVLSWWLLLGLIVPLWRAAELVW